jgi:hypothetical protein
MTPRKQTELEPVTMAHLRGHGVTRLLVYCTSIACNHSATISGDTLPDDFVPRSLGPRLVCTRCRHVGADVRPDWDQRFSTPRPGRAHVRL